MQEQQLLLPLRLAGDLQLPTAVSVAVVAVGSSHSRRRAAHQWYPLPGLCFPWLVLVLVLVRPERWWAVPRTVVVDWRPVPVVSTALDRALALRPRTLPGLHLCPSAQVGPRAAFQVFCLFPAHLQQQVRLAVRWTEGGGQFGCAAREAVFVMRSGEESGTAVPASRRAWAPGRLQRRRAFVAQPWAQTSCPSCSLVTA